MSAKFTAFVTCWVTVGDLEDSVCYQEAALQLEREKAYSVSFTHSPSVHRTENRMD